MKCTGRENPAKSTIIGTFCVILPPSGKKYLQGGDDVAIIHVIENILQIFANFQNETNTERTLRV